MEEHHRSDKNHGGLDHPPKRGKRGASKLLRDAMQLARMCGPGVAAKWVACVAATAPQVLRAGHLGAADTMMGEGPFRIHARGGPAFSIRGPEAFSGIREMYCRDVYLRGGRIKIPPSGVVVDLGANMGNFTVLALAHGSSVRVLAVEPSAIMNERFAASVGLNAGFLKRAKLIRAFVGGKGEKQAKLIERDPHYKGAPWVSEEKLIELGDLKTIDVLKCDIEGGEFELFQPGGRLIGMARAIACEVHAFAGDVSALLKMVEEQGFVIEDVQWDSDGSATFLANRRHIGDEQGLAR